MAFTNTVTLSLVRICKCVSSQSQSMMKSRVLRWYQYYLLWRNLVCVCPEVHFLVHIHTGNHEEDARAPGSSWQESAQAEDDRSLILLDNLHHEEEREGQEENDEEDGEDSQESRAHPGPIFAVWNWIISWCLSNFILYIPWWNLLYVFVVQFKMNISYIVYCIWLINFISFSVARKGSLLLIIVHSDVAFNVENKKLSLSKYCWILLFNRNFLAQKVKWQDAFRR